MNYLLNKKLSFEEKGLMALMLHLQEGGIKITNETIKHYCEYCLSNIEIAKLLLPLRILEYIEISEDGDEAFISIVREDNIIKE
jgi:hypothetical protein